MPISFEQEIVSIAESVAPEDQEVQDTSIELAVSALEDIDRRYGPNSDGHLLYHNASHSLDVCRRTVRLLNLTYPYVQPKYRNHIYDLAILAGALHDYEQDLGPIKNEKASAEYAQASAAQSSPLYQRDGMSKRLKAGILATAVVRNDEGEIVQTNLQTGAHDPLKFAMGFADINGIAMEGDLRMFRDATRLCYELFEDPSIDDLYGFLVNQAGFLRERLNDGRVKSDIAYYFPDSIDEVYKHMEEAFHSNIISSYKFALLLRDRPELKASVGFLVQNIDIVDRSILGELLAKELKKKVEEKPD
jgi:hypothetical protein